MDSKFLFIGNGKSALNLKERINEYDFIVRFNVFKLNSNVGNKTDLHIINDKNFFIKKILSKNAQNLKKSIVKYEIPITNHILRKRIDLVKSKLEQQDYNLPKIFHTSIIKHYSPIQLNKQASTGLVVLLYFTHRNFDCTVIGFDNLTDDECNLNNDHYFEKNHRAAGSHDWKQEREIVKLLPIKILK
mgnify:CR=1 FL=1